MTLKADKNEAVARGQKALIARLEAELKQSDDDGSTEQFLDAEATVDQFLEAVGQKLTTMPTSEDLAFACAVLLIPTGAVEQRDMPLLGQLYAPEVGIDMHAIAPQIEEMKSRAIARLEEMATQHDAPADGSFTDNVPF